MSLGSLDLRRGLASILCGGVLTPSAPDPSLGGGKHKVSEFRFSQSPNVSDGLYILQIS